MSMIGGAIYLDTSGREAAKYISFSHEGMEMGTTTQKNVFITTYIIMAVIGVGLIAYSISDLIK